MKTKKLTAVILVITLLASIGAHYFIDTGDPIGVIMCITILLAILTLIGILNKEEFL